MTALFIVQFGSDRIKPVGGSSSIWKFSAPYGPVLTKLSECHNSFKVLADRQKI